MLNLLTTETKQVDKTHYEFLRYISKKRWNSIWHQLDEVIRLRPKNVLEIGPGLGIFKQTATLFGLQVETLDLDPNLQPDHVGEATNLLFADDTYDVVCAFQMLEHLPYESSLQAFQEMARVARRYVVISLPDAKPAWRFRFDSLKFISFTLLIPHPFIKRPKHVFDGEHFWEINKNGYNLTRVVSDLCQTCRLIKTYRVLENPYHRFFVFENDLNDLKT